MGDNTFMYLTYNAIDLHLVVIHLCFNYRCPYDIIPQYVVLMDKELVRQMQSLSDTGPNILCKAPLHISLGVWNFKFLRKKLISVYGNRFCNPGPLLGFWSNKKIIKLCYNILQTMNITAISCSTYLQMADCEYAGPSVALRACPTWVWVRPRERRRILNCFANSLISSKLIPSTVVLSVEFPTVSVEAKNSNFKSHTMLFASKDCLKIVPS